MSQACVAVVLATIVVLVALAGSVRAQSACATAISPLDSLYCSIYLRSPTEYHPTLYCCNQVSLATALYGADCYCKKLLMVNPSSRYNMTKAYSLPADCEVPVDMTNCPAPTPATPAPAALPSPPAGSTPTPPGAKAPPSSTPTTATPTPPSSGSSGSSLALPIAGGVTAGGLTLFGIVWLIMSRCKLHMRWDVNAPCWCCTRRPPKQSQRLDICGTNKVSATTNSVPA